MGTSIPVSERLRNPPFFSRETMTKAAMTPRYVAKSTLVVAFRDFSFFMSAPQTFSGTYLPKRPAGRTSSTIISTAKTMELASCMEM